MPRLLDTIKGARTRDIFNNGAIASKLEQRHALRWAALSDSVGAIDPVEEFFHRVFGFRGTTESELSTGNARSHLQTTYERLQRKINSVSGTRLTALIELTARISRHLQVYPETDAEARNWFVVADNLEREAKRYLGLPVEALVFSLAALGLGGFALYRFMKVRKNPRRRRNTKLSPSQRTQVVSKRKPWDPRKRIMSLSDLSPEDRRAFDRARKAGR